MDFQLIWTGVFNDIFSEKKVYAIEGKFKSLKNNSNVHNNKPHTNT
jgi:hypothetical protein